MTDADYINAFRSDDQQIISRFYATHRVAFLRDIGSYYRILNTDLLAEIFQESIIRFWRNIVSEKLTAENLTTSLYGYLFSIGKYVAQELFRREGIQVTSSIDEKDAPTILPTASTESLWQESEQQKAVRRAVYEMGEPCAPLLLLFYWDKLSWEEIASRLNYKDANSAKTQKYKCIQKLKNYIGGLL